MNTDRIKDRMRELGLSQAALAARIGATQGAVGQIVNGMTNRSRLLPDIAKALGVTTEYLLGDESGRSVPTLTPEAQREAMLDELGIARVREVDVSYGMGGGSLVEDFPEQRWAHLDAEWVAGFTRSPAQALFVASGIGDSMAPTLLDSDRLLIDRGQRQPAQQDRLWALAYGDLGMVKRVRRLPGDRFLIMSDNDAVGNFEAVADEVHFIGRVVATIRRV